MNNDTLKIFVKTAGIISSLYLFLVGIAGMSSAIKGMGSEFAETVQRQLVIHSLLYLSGYFLPYYFRVLQQQHL